MGQRVDHPHGFSLVLENHTVSQRSFALNPELPLPVSALSNPELVFEEVGPLSVRKQQITHFYPIKEDGRQLIPPTLYLCRSMRQ